MDTKPLHRTKAKLLTLLHLKKRPQKPTPSSPLPSTKESPVPPAEKTLTTLSPLESLPAELKLHILTTLPNLQSLRCLVRASPEYYHTFRSSKRQVLKAVLLREASPYLPYAKRVCEARRVVRGDGWLDSISSLLRDRALENEEEDDGEELAKLHLLIQSLTASFCRYALRPVSRPAQQKGKGGKEKDWDGEISETEKFRIQRAMYRVELFVALFTEGRALWFRSGYQPRDFGGQEIADLFFGDENGDGDGMKPWEVEELACVRDWMVGVYGRVLEETRALVWELDVEREREELRCFLRMREGVELEERARKQVHERLEFWEHDQSEVLLMLGLPFFERILKAKSTEDKFELWKEHLIPTIMGPPAFLTAALEAEPQSVGGHGHRRRLEFEGDFENGPNAAWVQSKKTQDREDQDRWFLDDAELWREWGYCLWDEERLKGWGFGDWSWRDGQRRRRGRWVCTPQVRSSGRVVPKWAWVADEMG